MKKQVTLSIDENNRNFLQNLRREVMLENCVNLTYSQIMEYGLIELRRNNGKNELKKQLVNFNRKGPKIKENIIKNLK